MIGQANSEIRRRKKKKDLNYSGKTEWLAASYDNVSAAIFLNPAPALPPAGF